MSASAMPIALGALAGGLGAVAVREAALASPELGRWLRAALEPLRRAGSEGYAPTADERRRLAVLGALGMLAGGAFVLGPAPAPLLAVAGPGAAGWAIARRRARYRRSVERRLPDVAIAIADALAAGRSTRAALGSAAASLDGAAAVELACVGAELDAGASTEHALAGLRARIGSPRVAAFAAALSSQRLGGGDLVALLRRFAAAAAERDRVVAEARSATAQARFTGLLVVAMPAGAALFAELFAPGFVAGLLANPASLPLLVAAAGLQVGGFVAIRRLSRVAG